MSDSEPDFDAKIAVQVARKLKAQRAGTQSAWFGLGMFGIIGWSVSVPTLLGALLGTWWDKHHTGGPPSWTLALLAAGLIIGCANAWYWVAQQNAAINHDPPSDIDD
jgi:ATP synthase protein I